MNSDPDQILNRLVVAALTVFVVVSLLLAAFVFREMWLQQRIAGLSSNLEVNLEYLEETTEEIESTMSEMRTTTGNPQATQEWDNVTELLEDVDQQLETIGENIDEVATVRDVEGDTILIEHAEAESVDTARNPADQVFTIFALLTGGAAIVIAILLGMAMRVQDNRLLV
jgi:hypothetical protein